MNTCKKCGYQMSDEVSFCKKCGTPITKNGEETVDEKKTEENLMQLSLEMRKISDQMIATYVRAVKAAELEVEESKNSAQTKITQLENKILECEGEIRRYKAYVSELEEKVRILENEKIDVIPASQQTDEEKNPLCPNCNEPITEDMDFCGNCGKKLI
ncbi:zinc-ribbon domain-containing protein [Anaerotignum sp.]